MAEMLGVCIGASTVSLVKVRTDGTARAEVLETRSIPHDGDPKGVFLSSVRSMNGNGAPVVVTGRKFRELCNLPSICEPEATECALRYIADPHAKERFTAIASAGGENFIVYPLDEDGRIASVIAGNKCASGTGEFFLQQIRRMNLSVNEALHAAQDARPFKVSGRCSVFCKSDCTHALNHGVPIGEVAAGLSEMTAEKIEELLRKTNSSRVLVVGGTARNSVVMDFLRKKVPNIVIPGEAGYFEALGAALWAVEHEVAPVSIDEAMFLSRESSFDFHAPLSRSAHRVSFKSMARAKARDGDRCILGLDVGSTTTKAILLRINDEKILGGVYLRTNGNPIKASRECYAGLLQQVPEKVVVVGLGVCGSGRYIAGLHALTDGVINEIIAHAAAAAHFDPEVDTIFEIGGQDAKYTYLVNNVPADYAMNEACSAGTGSFLEEAAKESLDIDVGEIADIAMKGSRPPNFNDQCAAFISSDIKTAFQENISREDIVAGLVYSICMNYINRVKGQRQVGRKIFMQGGVCYNRAVPIAMASIVNADIVVPPEPGLMGSYGVALEVKKRLELGLMREQPFDLKELAEREVRYGKSFICAGGKERCDRGCEIQMLEVRGRAYPFGGACNRYYNQIHNVRHDQDTYDYVKKRYELTFKTYAPPADLEADAKSVGISQSLHVNTLYPLYYNFFTRLGFKVILSDTVKEEGIDRELSAFCFPVQLSLGLFQDLLDKEPDFLFVPNLVEMYTDDKPHHRSNENACCVFVNGEPFLLKQAFRDYGLGAERFLDPTLNFSDGYGSQERQFVEIARRLGIEDARRAKDTYRYAVARQQAYLNEMSHMADEFLRQLERDPSQFAIVLFGRPYNAFTDIANKGIPQKFSSRGMYVIPYDMFDYRNFPVGKDHFFEIGKKILKVADFVKRHPQLFGTYVTNFLCGPDSFLIQQFRDIMATKPSLTLELDGHTADAGITTRVEAALDIIRNYREIQAGIRDPDFTGYRQADIQLGTLGGYYIDSDGKKLPITDSGITMVIPAMNVRGAALFAAGIRSAGINAVPMPEATPDVLNKARAVVSGKECLPLQLCTGHLMDYLERVWDRKQKVAFFVNKQFMSCRIGMYHIFLKEYVRKQRLRNVAVIALDNDDNYAGLGPKFMVKAWQSVVTGDVVEDMRAAVMANAVDPKAGIAVFKEAFEDLVRLTERGKLYAGLELLARRLREEVPSRIPIEDSKYVVMCGEVYVRRDGFSHKWLDERLAKKGFVVKIGYLSEWVYYLEFLQRERIIKPDLTLAGRIETFVRRRYMRHAERKIKQIVATSGYYEYMETNIEPLIRHGEHIIRRDFIGEPCLTTGIAMLETIHKYCGMVNMGPFGCMPVRLTEGILSPEMKIKNKVEACRRIDPEYELPPIFHDEMGLPFLTIESDGNVYPQVIEARLETFTMQADRVHQLMMRAKQEGTLPSHAR